MIAAGMLSLGAAAAITYSAGGPAASAAGKQSAIAALAPYLKPPTKLVVSQPLRRRPPVVKAVFLSNGIEIAQEISAGMQAGSAALGWNYSTLSVDQNNPATIASNMLTAINDGAKVVFVSATPDAVFSSALATARQKGTLIIDVASGNPPTPGITALVNNASANGPEWGKILALGALADAQRSKLANPSVLLVTAPVFATILDPTDTAAAATIKRLCPGCTFATLGISANDLFGGMAPADVVSYLQANPGVKYILQDSSLTDPGLTAALDAAGMSAVKIFGVAPLAPQVQAVQSGAEAGWVVDPLEVEGWMSVDAAARKLTGGNPSVYDKKGIPSYLLVKSNANGPTEVPADYRRRFKQMWHVGQ